MRFFICALMGIAGHEVRPITNSMDKSWGQLTNNAVGAILIGLGLFLHLGNEKEITRPGVLLAFLQSVLGVGAGVALAWFADPFFGD